MNLRRNELLQRWWVAGVAGCMSVSAWGQAEPNPAAGDPSSQSAAEVRADASTPSATVQAEQPKSEETGGAEPTEASPAPGESKSAPAYDVWTAKQLTGDWGGARTQLKESGIDIQLTSQTQFMANMKGGLETANGTDFAGTYDLTMLLDFEKMKWIDGGTFFFRAKGSYGGEVSDFDREKIGGLFRTDGDAGPEEPIFVDKWWWRQRLLDDRIELRVGRLVTAKDLFDENAAANSEDIQFLNTALVTNPTIPHRNGLGLYASLWPVDWLNLRAAVVDNDARPTRTGFDSAFHDEARFAAYAELGLAPKWICRGDILPGHYRFGTWYDPRTKTEYRNTFGGLLARRVQTGDYGFYFGSDQMLWKEQDDPKDEQGLSAFARYGFAHEDRNLFEHFWAVGAQYRGPIPGRDRDTVAFAVAQGILSDDLRRATRPRADSETVYELYYAYELAPWCVLTPDLQYVVNPGGEDNDRDAFVFGLRLRAIF